MPPASSPTKGVGHHTLVAVESIERTRTGDGDEVGESPVKTDLFYVNNDDDDESESGESVVYEKNPESGEWECKPYKSQLLQEEISRANEGGKESHIRIIAKLNDLGVRVFVVPHQSSEEMFDDIHHVANTVASDNRCRGHADNQSCLLYEDAQGRLYNLTLIDPALGITGRWKDAIAAFSGFEAMVALTVLARVFPCVSDRETDSDLDVLKPGPTLVLVLGLVFSEETSLSWMNASMFVRGMPSIAAYALNRSVGTDWMRKIMIILLAIATSSTGHIYSSLTIAGVSFAVVILLSNLGSRAWRAMKWTPLQYSGAGASFVAYLAAVATGLVFPYMGHREIQAGGKAAIESVIRCAVGVAAIFVLSDYSKVKDNVVDGLSKCHQEKVNLAVGVWYIITLCMSMAIVKDIPPAQQWPEADGEPLLVEDQSSPVGFRVPNLPTFPVSPLLAKRGTAFCTIRMELVIGVAVALAMGGLILYTATTNVYNDGFTKPF